MVAGGVAVIDEATGEPGGDGADADAALAGQSDGMMKILMTPCRKDRL